MTLPILLTAENHEFYGLPSSAGAEHGLPMPYAGSGRPADSRPPSPGASRLPASDSGEPHDGESVLDSGIAEPVAPLPGPVAVHRSGREPRTPDPHPSQHAHAPSPGGRAGTT